MPERERRRILLIDDDRTVLRLMRRTLIGEFTVLTATERLEGYALLCEHRPDLVLLDIMMPMMNGWRLLQNIRSNLTVSQTPVIVVTGLPPEATQHEAHGLQVTSIRCLVAVAKCGRLRWLPRPASSRFDIVHLNSLRKLL